MRLADIEKWQPEAIREVFRAAVDRGAAAQDASRQLGNLPFVNWGGDAAEAARNAGHRLRRDLDTHGNVMAVVAAAGAKAADDVAVLRRTLSLLYTDADRWGFAIDNVENSVSPVRDTRESQQTELVERIRALLTTANIVDDELARVIDFADGDLPVPAFRSDVQRILDDQAKPPADPTEFATWWSTLTQMEKDALWEHDQYLGNHGGMPAEDRDHYNRRKLEDEFTRAAIAHSEALAIAAEHPDWANGENLPRENKPGTVYHERTEYDEWEKRLADAHDRARNLDDLRVVREQLDAQGADRMLLLLDTQSGERPHAAIAQGNPDTATNVATFVPGTGSRLSTMGGDMSRVDAMQDAAGPGTSVIAWFGYDAPQDIWNDAPQREYADAAAPKLERFQDGLRASHEGEPSLNTVIGHSYGTTVVGAASSGGHTLNADQVVFVASPGTTADHVSEFRLTGVPAGDIGDHIFATKAAHDPVPLYPLAHNGAGSGLLGGVSVIPFVGPMAGSFVASKQVSTDDFGMDPTSPTFGGVTFRSDPGTATEIRGFQTYNPSAHSEYWTPGNDALENMGSIIAGRGVVN